MLEKLMKVVFQVAACVSIAMVLLICIFLFASGLPAIKQIGVAEFLFGREWKPGNHIYGIFPMIIGSVIVTALSILMGVPIGIFGAIFMVFYCPEKIYKMLKEGKSVNDLSPEQQQALRVGNNILSQYEQNEWAKYRGLRRFDHVRQYAQNQEEPDFFTYSNGSYVREAKNGAKLAIAGIKARTADAERFQKMIIESMKNQDKAMDRLAKSMVNYVKDIMK